MKAKIIMKLSKKNLIFFFLFMNLSFGLQAILTGCDDFLSVKIFKDIQSEVEAESFNDNEFTEDILTAFTVLYQKVVEISVTHYLMNSIVSDEKKESLQIKITKVIITDLIKIVGLLFAKLVYLIKNPELSWQDKLKQCWWVVALIIILKKGSEEIAYNTGQTVD